MNANVWKNAFYVILAAVIGFFVGIGLDSLFGASEAFLWPDCMRIFALAVATGLIVDTMQNKEK